jgi:short-subunit dehydrogenase
MQLHEKTTFLTGAASGLGRELALQLDRAGCRLLLADRDAAGLNELQNALTRPAQLFVCDLSQPAERAQVGDALVGRATRLDVLIHCAGVGSHSRVEQLTPDEVNLLLQVNAVAPLELTSKLLPLLPKGQPAGVVFIGSVAGELPTPAMSAYAASKAALHAFSRAIDIELRAAGQFSLLVILGALKNTRFTASIRHPAGGQPGWYRRLDADPRQAAQAILQAIRQEQTRLVYPHWLQAVLLFNRFFAPLALAISRQAYRRYR